jgi:hypothetical protein
MTFRRMTGYLQLRRLDRWETTWFWSASREFGLWSLTIHAGWFRFEIIGPFRFRKAVSA